MGRPTGKHPVRDRLKIEALDALADFALGLRYGDLADLLGQPCSLAAALRELIAEGRVVTRQQEIELRPGQRPYRKVCTVYFLPDGGTHATTEPRRNRTVTVPARARRRPVVEPLKRDLLDLLDTLPAGQTASELEARCCNRGSVRPALGELVASGEVRRRRVRRTITTAWGNRQSQVVWLYRT